MKYLSWAIVGLVATAFSATAMAGERGRHWRGHHHHYSHHHSHHNHGAYLVGGMVLGAVVNELSQPRTTYVKDTVYVERAEERRHVEEYLLDSDGSCYEVEYRRGRRVLFEVPRSACY